MCGFCVCTLLQLGMVTFAQFMCKIITVKRNDLDVIKYFVIDSVQKWSTAELLTLKSVIIEFK